MIEYITKEEAKEAVDYAVELFSSEYDAICDEIDRIPNADVAPVVHGKWEPGNPICPVCGNDKFKELDADIWADWMPLFCPNCGAKMDLEEDEQ